MLVKEISLKNDNFNIWDDKKIKKAFNFGKGTKKDMLRYINDNKKYARFEIINSDEVK